MEPRSPTVPPSMFQRDARYRGRKAPPEFEWVTVQMDVTRWLLTALLGAIGLGIWTAAIRIYDLGYKADEAKKVAAQNEAINKKQDQEIKELSTTLTKHQIYLEQILSAVRRINN